MSHILPNEAKLLYITLFKRQGHKTKLRKKKEETRQRVKRHYSGGGENGVSKCLFDKLITRKSPNKLISRLAHDASLTNVT